MTASPANRLRIERLGQEGDGFASLPGGGSLRVPGGLPGEVWEGAASGGVLAAARLVEPVPARRDPPCPHYANCGGCSLQHAEDSFIAEWKAEVVARALKAHGIAAEVEPVLTSPPFSRRRAVLAGRRTKKAALAGFHGRRSETIAEVPACRVLRPEITAALPLLARITRAAAARSRPVTLAVTTGPAGLDIDVGGAKEADAALRSDLAELAREAGAARLSLGGVPVAAERPAFQRMGRVRVVPPPGAFLQATAEGEAALVASVCEILGDAGRIADLFAGCGTFTLPLAEKAEVHAVEGQAAMLEALDAGWRAAPGLKRVSVEARDLFRRPLLAGELARFDAAVIDPPRAGAEAQIREIAVSGLACIAMVSCNPATFARDAARLIAAGFRMGGVQPVDQFLWSGHVELVAGFTR